MTRQTGADAHLAHRPQSEPDWVIKMREHYVRTGFYRAEDVTRVLGDPRQPFVGRGRDDLLVASKIAG
jgi:hypothetical protein